jgi:hypothetical protein
MEKQLAQIANKGMEGEPQNPVIHIVETNQTFDFSQIKFVNENGSLREVSLIDADFDQSDIQHILLNQGHKVDITWDDNNNVTLYF